MAFNKYIEHMKGENRLTKFNEYDILNKRIKIFEVLHLKYLPEELQKEYDREHAATPDIEAISPPLINISDVLRAYFILADYFTDPSSGQIVEPMLIGVKNRDLLSSAVCRQIVSYGGRVKYTDKLDICATLFFGLVKNHAFHDGNKRVALLTLLYQLNGYGYFPSAPVKEFEKLVVAVAASELAVKYRWAWKKFDKKDDCEIYTISYLLRRMTERKDHSYHINITMKEFCLILEKHDVQSFVENGKVHFRRKARLGIGSGRKEINHAVTFGGWTRAVGAQNARETLQKFDIYDQHPTYQSIMSGRDPLYKLIADFEQPLRRLKDE